MDRFLNRMLPAALALTVLLSACKTEQAQPVAQDPSGADPSSASGRYVETALPLPDGIREAESLHLKSDGTLELIYSDVGSYEGPHYLASSSDGGKTWEKQDAPWLDALNGSNVEDIVYDVDGNCYLLTETYTPEMRAAIEEKEANGEELTGLDFPTPELLRVDPDGNTQTIPIQWERSAGDFVQAEILAYVGDGKLVTGGYYSVTVYDTTTGENTVSFEVSGQISRCVVQDGTIFASGYGGNGLSREISRFDLSAGETLDTLPCGTDASYFRLISSPEGLLRADETGLWKLGESEKWEQIVDGSITSLNMPTVTCTDALHLPDGDWLALVDTGGQYVQTPSLLQFHFDETLSSQPEGTIVISTLRDSETLRQAIGVYQKNIPQMKAELNVLLDEGSSMTVSDAVRSLNVELLAGKGPDLLLLDSMPIASYIEKGVLMDLSPALDGLPLLENVKGTYQTGGEIPAVPCRFGVPFLWATDDCSKSAGSLSELAAYFSGWTGEINPLRGRERTPFFDMSCDALMKLFYPVCAPAWIKEDGSIDTQPLAEFLEEIRTIAGSGTYEDDAGDYVPDPSMLGLYWAEGETEACAYLSQSFGEMAYADAGAQLNADGSFQLFRGQSAGNVFVPQAVLGIRKGTQYPDEVLEFVRTALSEEVQQTDLSDGYAVNTDALSHTAKNPYSNEESVMIFSSTNQETGEEFELHISWPSEAVMQEIEQLIRSVDTPCTIDETLLEMLVSETAAFFSGSSTAQEAAQSVAERAQAYLAE